jgi:hypothetical protein
VAGVRLARWLPGFRRLQKPFQPVVEPRAGALGAVPRARDRGALSAQPRLEDVADGVERVVVRAGDDELRKGGRRDRVERDRSLSGTALRHQQAGAALELRRERLRRGVTRADQAEKCGEECRRIVRPMGPELRDVRWTRTTGGPLPRRST